MTRIPARLAVLAAELAISASPNNEVLLPASSPSFCSVVITFYPFGLVCFPVGPTSTYSSLPSLGGPRLPSLHHASATRRGYAVHIVRARCRHLKLYLTLKGSPTFITTLATP